ncbi:SPRY-domain-containing protein [Aaosphaeria arxii CBS 175.79]|uniref:SPRY-domain-containing protein n=1 Tax=Aaosphaeria arxii CBS 175.79 TaxID=1450172 RepID=A0A6A5XX79_9PLEO|nr:SPRY-domain-containing protein [Aaosphaeria arxii CBS 175.79]KAF2017513.1 SPRY-domain-containing protein [Aaosphaeria arxii CBS 175.79]
MFRRSSYASVAAGNSGQPQGSAPTRSGAFSHLANNNSSSGSYPTQATAQSSRHLSRSLDTDGYNTNMSTSWGRGGPLPSYSSHFGYLHGSGPTGQDGPLPPFFVPSYLRGSKYAERVEDAYKAKVAAQRELRSTQSSNAGSLSTSSSSVNLHKMVPSHRGLSHEIIERAPVYVDDQVTSWPTKWNEADMYPTLDVDEGGLQTKFTGPTPKSNDEAGSIRADHPMPRQGGIYYYEVTIVAKGKDGRMIGIGFTGPKVVLSRIPGWEPDSFAYHGDDGYSYSNTTSGKPFGPKFGTLDVIGCGVNFRKGTAFFTRNGHFLGEPFKDIKPNLSWYPTVGMKKNGETLRVNFGQEPFLFDIDKMVQAEKAEIQREIAAVKAPPRTEKDKSPFDETAFIHSLVSQYLAHDGYVETARAFQEEVAEESQALANEDADLSYIEVEEDVDAINRQKIRAAILEGDIDKALKHTNAYYPSVLQNNENIYFKLRCRKFIEMIRVTNDLASKRNQIIPTPPSKRSTASNGHNDEYDFEMELDEQLGVHNGSWNIGAENMNVDDDDDEDPEVHQQKLRELTSRAIAYGMELRQEFHNDPRREVKRALEDTFALIAYENAAESALAPLLDVSGRVPVAEELNSAILVSLGKNSRATLERLTQQTEALVNELAEDGGPGAFINVRRDVLT